MAKATQKGYKGDKGKMPTNLPKGSGCMKNTFTSPSPKTRKVTSGKGY